VQCAFASDLMSDVLTLDCNGVLLVTGLCNMQTIRTAEMADVSCILFVRTSLIRSLAKAHCTSWSSRPLPHTTVAPVSAIICRIFIII
jgi:hypothetical protein